MKMGFTAEVSKTRCSSAAFSCGNKGFSCYKNQGFYTHMHTGPSNPLGLVEHPLSVTLAPAFGLGSVRGFCKFGFLKRW